LNEVDQMLIRMARSGDTPPSWLKNTRRIEHLPRFKRTCGRCDCDRVVSLMGLSVADYIERVKWVVDNLSDDWCLVEQTIHFCSDRDLVHYTMRWCEP
jgi:hypothetical protein